MKTYFNIEIISILAALSLSGVSAQGQSGTISGFVRDSTNRESLSYVNVFVPETGFGAVTNRDGYYVISGAPRGQVTVVASIIGYRMDSVVVDLAPRGTDPSRFLPGPHRPGRRGCDHIRSAAAVQTLFDKTALLQNAGGLPIVRIDFQPDILESHCFDSVIAHVVSYLDYTAALKAFDAFKQRLIVGV